MKYPIPIDMMTTPIQGVTKETTNIPSRLLRVIQINPMIASRKYGFPGRYRSRNLGKYGSASAVSDFSFASFSEDKADIFQLDYNRF